MNTRKTLPPTSDYNNKQCPFDPAHMLDPERLQRHLCRCRKAILNQPTHPQYSKVKDMMQCKFNALHYVPSAGIKEHHGSCPSRKELVRVTEQQKSMKESEPAWKSLVCRAPEVEARVNDGEDWDDDGHGRQPYDPMEKVTQNPHIIFNKQGLTKAQRRDYVQERRMMAAEVAETRSEQRWIPRSEPEEPEDQQSDPGEGAISDGSKIKSQDQKAGEAAKAHEGFQVVGRGRGRGRGWGRPPSPDGGNGYKIEAMMAGIVLDPQQPASAGRGLGRGSPLRRPLVGPPPGFEKR